MAGGSYVGITQYLTAARQPPHLAAIAPQVALSDLYRDAYTHGGVPNLFFDAQYTAVQGAPGTAGTNTDPALLQESVKAKLGQSAPGTTAFDFLARPNDGPFYRRRSPIRHADDIEVPALILGSWRDGLSARGAPEMYRRLARRHGVETRLYMDPCTHKGCGAPFAPLTNPARVQNPAALVFEFMRRHLMGAKTPWRAPVRYYVQAQNRYHNAGHWPPANSRFQRFELGAHSLRREPARTRPPARGSARYVTDPAAGWSMTFNKYGTVAATPYLPTDQRLEGPHGLTFRTRPLGHRLRLVGPLGLHLVAASTATDTDWYAKLADVAPDGTETIITEGALRASHRALVRSRTTPARPYHPHTHPRAIEPGRFYRYAIEIWPTAYQIAPGHQLQLRLTSSDLPTHLPGSFKLDRDHPQHVRIELNPPAVNTVRFDDSYLVLPVAR
jgi:putative CocE/NonD family hydrolase